MVEAWAFSPAPLSSVPLLECRSHSWPHATPPVGIGMTIMSLSPVLILAPAHWIFGQRITLQEIIGACISVLGVSLFFIG